MAANTPPPSTQTKRERLIERWGALDNEYATWRPRHREIIQYIQPDRGFFEEMDTPNKGTRKDSLILDSTATDADKKLTAAMDTGISSPVREWLRLTTTIGEDVATEYLYDAQKQLFHIFAKSNTYKVLWSLYRDLVGPGTAVAVIDTDPRDVIRLTHIPCGQYRLATDAEGRVDTLYRRFSMSVGQMVRKFGIEKCSRYVQDRFKLQKFDEWILVQHSIEPRELREYGKIDAKNKPWASCWIEVNADSREAILLESGYDEKPFIAARWDYVGQNAYGTDNPSMQCIGDVKQLQDWTSAGAATMALINKPPMNVPSSLMNASLVPGARNALPDNTQAKFEPSVVIPPAAITVNGIEKQELRARIRQAFLSNFLFAITGAGDAQQREVQKTAAEIYARKDEGLLQISSAYKIFSDEALDVLVNRTLAEMQRRGIIEPPPQDLHEVDSFGRVTATVRVEYINNLAAAQKLLGISAVERMVNSAIGIFQGTQDPSVLDNIDFDQAIHILAETLGVKPSLIRKADVIQAMRDARQKAQQAKAQGEAMATGAKAVKDLGTADPANVDELARRFGPYASAQVRA